MNLCPCGYYGDHARNCTCTPLMIQRYLQRISGPLLDRVDIHIEAPRLKQDQLVGAAKSEPSVAIRDRVTRARNTQQARFDGSGIYCNAHMRTKQLRQFCKMSEDVEALLRSAITQLNLSARAFDRILKLSRTIADLAESPEIETPHVAEAIQYRSLDRKFWG